MDHSTEKIQLVRELHKPIRRKFKRRHTVVNGLLDLWQSDLAQLDKYSRFNKSYKYILIVIDCFSKYLWARPLKTKTAEEVAKAFETILNEGCSPRNLQTDQGLEFFNAKFKQLMKKFNINHYNTFNCTKASMAERVIRSIKERLYKYFSLNGSFKWIEVLPEIVNGYNHTKHSTINMRPIDVTKNNEIHVLKCIRRAVNPVLPTSRTFSIDDFVRISKVKHIFEKGYIPNWTTEVFKVMKIKNTLPITYQLKDLEGRPIIGSFYKEELQSVKYPEVYLVEKIIKKKADKVYVKWLGFPNSHNSWINSANVL